MNDDFIRPKLTEIGIKSFLNITLKKCNEYRLKYMNMVYNIVFFVIFVTILSTILVIKYRGKPTEEEKEQKEIEKKHYILSKIKNYKQDKLKQQQMLISGLPHF